MNRIDVCYKITRILALLPLQQPPYAQVLRFMASALVSRD
jgi:hypothetical protein